MTAKAPSRARARTNVVEPYDFRRPATLTREQTRSLELVLETFARQWGTQLTAQVRVVSRAVLVGLDLKTYDEYAQQLPATTAMVLCELEDVEPRAIVQLPASAALVWVGRMLGGAGLITPPDRAFTPIEQAIVRGLVEDALEDLKYSIGSLLTAQITVETLTFNPQFAQAATPGDLMVVSSFQLDVADSRAIATIAIPAEALLPQLGATKPRRPVAIGERLRDEIGSVPVEVTLRTQARVLGPSEVLHLAPGDVVRLPHPVHRPLDLMVDGQHVGRAAVGSSGARLACIVVDTEEIPA